MTKRNDLEDAFDDPLQQEMDYLLKDLEQERRFMDPGDPPTSTSRRKIRQMRRKIRQILEAIYRVDQKMRERAKPPPPIVPYVDPYRVPTNEAGLIMGTTYGDPPTPQPTERYRWRVWIKYVDGKEATIGTWDDEEAAIRRMTRVRSGIRVRAVKLHKMVDTGSGLASVGDSGWLDGKKELPTATPTIPSIDYGIGTSRYPSQATMPAPTAEEWRSKLAEIAESIPADPPRPGFFYRDTAKAMSEAIGPMLGKSITKALDARVSFSEMEKALGQFTRPPKLSDSPYGDITFPRIDQAIERERIAREQLLLYGTPVNQPREMKPDRELDPDRTRWGVVWILSNGTRKRAGTYPTREQARESAEEIQRAYPGARAVFGPFVPGEDGMLGSDGTFQPPDEPRELEPIRVTMPVDITGWIVLANGQGPRQVQLPWAADFPRTKGILVFQSEERAVSFLTSYMEVAPTFAAPFASDKLIKRVEQPDPLIELAVRQGLRLILNAQLIREPNRIRWSFLDVDLAQGARDAPELPQAQNAPVAEPSVLTSRVGRRRIG